MVPCCLAHGNLRVLAGTAGPLALARVVLFLGEDRKRLVGGTGESPRRNGSDRPAVAGISSDDSASLRATRDIGRDEAWDPSVEAVILTFSNR